MSDEVMLKLVGMVKTLQVRVRYLERLERPTTLTPTAHWTSHQQGGSDPIVLDTLEVGPSPAKSSLPGLTLGRVLTAVDNARGFHDASIYSGNLNKAYASYDAMAETGGANNLDHLINFQARNEHAGAGTLAEYFGFGSFPNISGGAITDLFQFYGEDPWDTGTITNNYGLYLGSLTRGTNNYAIYTNAGAISFGDGVTIRTGGLALADGALTVVSSGNPGKFTRTVALTTGGITLGVFLASSSGDITDGFGSLTAFSVKDAAGSESVLAYIGAVRAGADNTGDFIVQTDAAGTITEKLRVTSGGDVKVIVGRFYPVQKTTAAAPTYEKGAIYFDTTLNKLRVGGATAWETITSA